MSTVVKKYIFLLNLFYLVKSLDFFYKIIYKLDINGNGQLVETEKILKNEFNQFERFRWMCILSGCDYLESLPGIGLGKAKKLFKMVQKNDIELVTNSI